MVGNSAAGAHQLAMAHRDTRRRCPGTLAEGSHAVTAVPKRRWLRFSLRWLFVVVTVESVRHRQSILDVIESRNGTSDSTRPDRRNVPLVSVHWSSLQPGGELPLTWRLLGAKPVHYIDFYKSRFREQEIAQIQRLFPEADIALWEFAL